MTRSLVAVDWGTSSLRAARLAGDGRVLEERCCARGILTVPAGGFAHVLVARSLAWIAPKRIALVPGLCCEAQGAPDVMRGEEVQVFGAMDLLQQRDGIFVLPGTHSKWVRVQAGRIQSFATFMSGEFYALLRQHSILERMMPAADAALDQAAFTRGLHQAQESASLLRSAFSARTLALFERLPAAALPSYLSGLVIGEELRLRTDAAQPVVLIGSPALTQRYALALHTLGGDARSLGSEATWRGLWALAQTLEQT
jgi:2-dehydro-3-deoxygalactonokinase